MSNDRMVLARGDEYRNLAADWHGGMSSALYAYASTGTILAGLQDEIDQCIAWCEANDDAGESDDCPDLYDMAGYVALAIVRHSIDGKGDE